MRILFLVHSFNSLSQRLYTELTERGHDVSVEFDVNDAITEDAVALFRPDLLLAPFLRRAIPTSVHSAIPCFVVHPGVPGDRGPSALDHAILRNEQEWGVTVLQATEEFDAGPVWAHQEFPMRPARKSSLYRNEVTEAAVRAVHEAIELFETRGHPVDPAPVSLGRWNAPCTQAERRIEWAADGVTDILRKIRSADGRPGLLDSALGEDLLLFNPYPAYDLHGKPGTILAVSGEAVCLGARDGAVWITHMQKPGNEGIKLPAARIIPHLLEGVPRIDTAFDAPENVFREIRYEEADRVGFIHFDFYNGAMSTEQCMKLREAVTRAKERPTRVLVLFGSEDFWSNGIHLCTIEASESPAEESMRNIEAMDDLCLEILTDTSRITISAMQGNAGAGGVFLALTADRIFARSGVVLNPHYKSMGNLFGSEYWTYLLPQRVGAEEAERLMSGRLPVSARTAHLRGLIDEVFGATPSQFREEVRKKAVELAASEEWESLVEKKRVRRQADEERHPLADYRRLELEAMRLNFFGFDPSYHVARYNFVHRIPHARTPLYLAHHRRAAPTTDL